MERVDFFFVVQAWPVLLKGLVVTLQLTGCANAIGVPLGFVLSLAAVSKASVVRLPVRAYIDFFRCTPALVQIVWFFFCVPMLFNVFWSPVFMGAVVLGMNLSAFNAEAFRASIQALPQAQADASVALGLSPWTRTAHVVLPQALRNAMPVLITNAIGIFQQSSLVALVGVGDLMYEGKLVSTQTYRPIETFSFLALFYLGVSVPFGRLAAFVERRMAYLQPI